MKGRLVKFADDDRKKIKSWGFVISLPRDEHGKYQQVKRQGFSTRDEADKALRAMMAEIEGGATRRRTTVSEYLDEWLKRSIVGKRAPRTLETYQHTISLIVPHVGSIRLNKLEPHQIERLYEEIAKTHAPSTVHRIHRVFKAALNRAVRWGYIPTSPMIRVDPPSPGCPRRNVPSVAELARAEEWLRSRYPVVWLAVFLAARTGMRRGELCGLRWRDIDWTHSMLTIVQQRQHRLGRELVGPTKTSGSTRPIPVGESVTAILKDWRRQHQEHTRVRGEPWSEDSYILAYLTGELIHPNTLSEYFRKAVTACALPEVSFHDLRHLHATILLESGAPVKVIAERLGHSSTRMVNETYAHVRETIQKEAVDMIERAFKN